MSVLKGFSLSASVFCCIFILLHALTKTTVSVVACNTLFLEVF